MRTDYRSGLHSRRVDRYTLPPVIPYPQIPYSPGCPTPRYPIPRPRGQWTGKHLWKHYLPVTSLAVGKNKQVKYKTVSGGGAWCAHLEYRLQGEHEWLGHGDHPAAAVHRRIQTRGEDRRRFRRRRQHREGVRPEPRLLRRRQNHINIPGIKGLFTRTVPVSSPCPSILRANWCWNWCGPQAFQDPQTLGPVYTKRQLQRCENSAMTLAILFSLKTMELFQIGIETHFQVTPIVFNENRIASVIAELMLTFDVNIFNQH